DQRLPGRDPPFRIERARAHRNAHATPKPVDGPIGRLQHRQVEDARVKALRPALKASRCREGGRDDISLATEGEPEPRWVFGAAADAGIAGIVLECHGAGRRCHGERKAARSKSGSRVGSTTDAGSATGRSDGRTTSSSKSVKGGPATRSRPA